MPRKYTHIKDYEKEIEELREEGYSSREISIKLGFSYKQIRNYFYRHNLMQRKMNAGITAIRRGRQPKEYVVHEQDNVPTLKYILARKDAKIKLLEMENELMRDFLSLTERK